MGNHGPPANEHHASPRRRTHQLVAKQCLGDSLKTETVAVYTTGWMLNLDVHTTPAASRHRRRKRGCGFSTVPLLAGVLALAGAVGGLLDGVEAVTVPEAPTRVDLDVVSGDEVAVVFYAPLSDGGSAVQSYEVR